MKSRITPHQRREIVPDIIVHETRALQLLNQKDTRTNRLRLREECKAYLMAGRRYYVHSDVIDYIINSR